MGEMTPHGSKYEAKAEKEESKEERAGHSEMARVRSVSDAAMPSSKQPHPHAEVHEAYKATKGMMSSHDEHRGDHHHKTMDAGEHKGMPHHSNKP